MEKEHLSIAQQVVVFAHSLREDGFYCRPRDSELRDEFGGRMISSSNDGESIISFSPTDVWEFEDGSRVEIGYSDAEVIAGVHADHAGRIFVSTLGDNGEALRHELRRSAKA